MTTTTTKFILEQTDDEEDERYCDNKNCPYGSYICFEELEKYSGKEWVCEKCSKEKVSDDEEEEVNGICEGCGSI